MLINEFNNFINSDNKNKTGICSSSNNHSHKNNSDNNNKKQIDKYKDKKVNKKDGLLFGIEKLG